MPIDPMLVLPLVLLAVMGFMMWRGNKKRAAQQEELRSKIGVGAEVMTQTGIYGTITEIDEANNVTTIETTPGTSLRVHSMTIANVVSPNVPDDASALSADAEELAKEQGESKGAAPAEEATPVAEEPEFDFGKPSAESPASQAGAERDDDDKRSSDSK